MIGGTLLVSGCCIGAGMLGLPIISGLAGFYPSLVMFIVSWLFMLATGFLFLETTLWFKGEVNLVTMASTMLGSIGKIAAWILFLFLFYCLLVAYIAGSGTLLVDFLQETTGVSLPFWMGQLFCVLIFAIFLYYGTRATDQLNRWLMIGLMGTYLSLLAFGIPHVQTQWLYHTDWSKAPSILPIMIVSFGFHNLIPSLTTYLDHHPKRLKLILTLGSAIPLIVYLAWEWLILGLIPVEGNGGFKEAMDNGQMVTQALRTAVNKSFVVEIAHAFAFFCIATSLIAVALSFVDFLADGLHLKKDKRGQAFLCALVLLPPLLCALNYPQIFHHALGYAGGVGAVLLFGVIPALMVWVGRYSKKWDNPPLLPGGKISLIFVILFACLIVGMQLMKEVV